MQAFWRPVILDVDDLKQEEESVSSSLRIRSKHALKKPLQTLIRSTRKLSNLS